MMTLCPACHDMATRGALTQDQQRAFKANPVNLVDGLVLGKLEITQEPLAVRLGSVLVVNDGPVLSINGSTIVAITHEEESALLSVDLHDENGDQLILISENEWLAGTPNVWDIQASYQKITLHSAERDIRLRIDLSTVPGSIRGRFWEAGQLVEITESGICVGGDLRVSEMALVRLPVSVQTDDSFSIGGSGPGYIVSEPDPVKKYRDAVNAYRGNQGNPLGFLASKSS